LDGGVSKKRCPSDGGPRVRIHLPPAVSLRTFCPLETNGHPAEYHARRARARRKREYNCRRQKLQVIHRPRNANQADEGGSVDRPRAADDFATIRARMADCAVSTMERTARARSCHGLRRPDAALAIRCSYFLAHGENPDAGRNSACHRT
jgi:hypothetical protein